MMKSRSRHTSEVELNPEDGLENAHVCYVALNLLELSCLIIKMNHNFKLFSFCCQLLSCLKNHGLFLTQYLKYLFSN